jgi:hypothetical protein
MEFNTALRLFRRISAEAQDILPPVSGATAKFTNLENFHLYWEDKEEYIRQQRKKCSYNRERREKYAHHHKTPEFREKQRKYEYLKKHPDATVVPPRQSESKQPRKYNKSSFTQHITVKSKDDPKAYQRQYQWFKIHPGATVYAPLKTGDKCPQRSNLTYKTISTQT